MATPRTPETRNGSSRQKGKIKPLKMRAWARRAVGTLVVLAATLGASAWAEDKEPSPAAEAVAKQFAATLRGGDLGRALALFTAQDRTWPLERHFAFDGVEPNLAFLVRQPAQLSGMSSSQWAADLGLGGVPWMIVCPGCLRVPTEAAVTMSVSFPVGAEPFLLPPHLAFGGPLGFARFMDYVKRPEVPDHLTLRVRPTLEPGLIPRPGSGRGYPSLATPQPEDAAPVLLPSGARLTSAQLAALMPRVTAVELTLRMSRSARFSSWRITHASPNRLNVRSVDGGLEVRAR